MNPTPGSISGNIVDINGLPINNALVKVLSTSYDPLLHEYSDSQGNYKINNIIPGEYNILVINNGYELNYKKNFSISSGENSNINFILKFDPSMMLSLITGDLIDSSESTPINGAVISLYKKNVDNTKELFSQVFTNNYGQFAFIKIPIGNYIINGVALGYYDINQNISINQNNQLLSVKLNTIKNPLASKGTVSGIIEDNNEPINRGDVILYKVNENNSLTPIAFTKTNENGVYLFSNVPNGNYKVKANKFIIS